LFKLLQPVFQVPLYQTKPNQRKSKGMLLKPELFGTTLIRQMKRVLRNPFLYSSKAPRLQSIDHYQALTAMNTITALPIPLTENGSISV
jgi:hypothetical protein